MKNTNLETNVNTLKTDKVQQEPHEANDSNFVWPCFVLSSGDSGIPLTIFTCMRANTADDHLSYPNDSEPSILRSLPKECFSVRWIKLKWWHLVACDQYHQPNEGQPGHLAIRWSTWCCHDSMTFGAKLQVGTASPYISSTVQHYLNSACMHACNGIWTPKRH